MATFQAIYLGTWHLVGHLNATKVSLRMRKEAFWCRAAAVLLNTDSMWGEQLLHFKHPTSCGADIPCSWSLKGTFTPMTGFCDILTFVLALQCHMTALPPPAQAHNVTMRRQCDPLQLRRFTDVRLRAAWTSKPSQRELASINSPSNVPHAWIDAKSPQAR